MPASGLGELANGGEGEAGFREAFDAEVAPGELYEGPDEVSAETADSSSRVNSNSD